MFTGIVEDIGKVAYIRNNGMCIRTSLDQIQSGDSLMVDGVCLTVTSSAPGKAVLMGIGRETLDKTTFSRIKPGYLVNLERALRLDSRIGGHIVYGHVMDIGRVISQMKVSNTKIIKIKAQKEFLSMLLKKGSVAVNGVSLTVNSIERDIFTVGVIPETLKRTNMNRLRISSRVNLEADILAGTGRL
jgi:riboflavin synthase